MSCTMCFKSRKTDEEGLNRSRELDKVIRQDEKRLAREVKLLLLGTRPHGCALSRMCAAPYANPRWFVRLQEPASRESPRSSSR